jgi:rhamnulokinase
MMNLAAESSFKEKIDPNDNVFLAPENMIEAVRNYLGKPDLPLDDVLSSVYHSLADSYRKAVEDIENISGKEIKSIHIVGGGSKDKYLNALTAEATGLEVFAGPTEGTAIGNLIVQMITGGEFSNLEEARKAIVID